MKFKHTAKVLKQFRKDAGLTQAELGEKIDLHPQHVSNQERNLCFMPKKNIKKFCKVLNLSEENILSLKKAIILDEKEHLENKWEKIFNCCGKKQAKKN